MAYSDQQRAFYQKAKAAGWAPEKIKAGIARLGARQAPAQAAPGPAVAAGVVPGAAAPGQAGAAPAAQQLSPQQEVLGEMGGLERFVAGAGGAFQGLGIGAQQLIPDALTSEAYRNDLQAQAEEHKRMMDPLSDTGAGMAGNIAGNVAAAIPAGIAATMAAPASIPGAIGAGIAEGAGMAALAPTTEEGERAENIAWGAGLGGAIPVAGQGIRAFAGQADPAMQKAAQTLKQYGVSVPLGNQMPGGLSKSADFVLENTPVVNNLLKSQAGKKTDKVREALFNMLGTEAPSTNEEMANIVKGLGGEIGAASMGKRIDVQDIAPEIKEVMKGYKNLLPTQRESKIIKYGNELMGLSKIPGAKLKGEAYQAIRSDMATEASRAAPEHAKVLRGMIGVLDDQFGKVLSPEEAAKVATTKERYRLAKALAGQDIKEGALDINKARGSVERAAKKGAVMPEARELLQAADMAIPKIKTGLTPATLAEGALAVTNPVALAKILGLGVGGKALTNTGVPQYLTNNKAVRAATSRALRGTMQTELSDED